MRMTYRYNSNRPWFHTEGDVKIIKTTAKSVFVECAGISLRLKRSEIVKGAEITRSGYDEGSDYYIVITVEEVVKK